MQIQQSCSSQKALTLADDVAMSKDTYSSLLVKTNPPVTDPREMATILTSSLRDLFGDFEPHSCVMDVTKGEDDDMVIVSCPKDSVKEIRAALTMVTPPPYMATNQYQFDVVEER